jgi:signal transduction histidine kinase
LFDEPETHLFRIAQEALTNVARHSGASRVIVQLKLSGEVVCLTIEDDGKGIQDAESTQSLGMTGMRARARAAGGVFRVQSPKSGGLRLEVEIPLPENIMKEDYEPHPHLTG